jgi:hypothetical protein
MSSRILDQHRNQLLTVGTNSTHTLGNGMNSVTNVAANPTYSQVLRGTQAVGTAARSSVPGRQTTIHDMALLVRFLNSQQPAVLSQLPAGMTFQVESQSANLVIAYSALNMFVHSITTNLAAMELKLDEKRDAREKKKTKDMLAAQARVERNERKKMKAEKMAEKIQQGRSLYKNEEGWETGIAQVRKFNPNADWGSDDLYTNVEVNPMQVVVAEPEMEPEYKIYRRVSPLRDSFTPDDLIKEEEGGWGAEENWD